MQIYKQEDIEKIDSELTSLRLRYTDILLEVSKLSEILKEEKAIEYLHQGVGRRLAVIERCVGNIFSIFPVERENVMCRDELVDVQINLHAFFVNIFGLLDNLAWVVIYEKQVADKIDKRKVGLFIKETQQYLSCAYRQYLNSSQIQQWHDQYLKNYRDALSHRIPLYIPPLTINKEQHNLYMQLEKEITDKLSTGDIDAANKLRDEQHNIGSICQLFVHGFLESKSVALHAQLISDFMTIEDIIGKYCELSFKRQI